MKKIRSGIYMILNLRNGKRYVGSAVNLEGRRKTHFRNLKNGGKGENSHLRNAYNKYGGDVFGWEVLEYVEDTGMLLSREDIYLKMYWPSRLLYNIYPVARSSLGRAEEIKQKHSKFMIELWQTKKFRQMQRVRNPMLWASQNKGEQGPAYGIRHSDESKQKSREAALKSWADPEYRQRMLETNPALKGWKGEQNPNYGTHFSIETKRKKSEAMKKYWARRKRAERLLVLAQLVEMLQKRLVCLATIACFKEGMVA